jgi:hypothetical protein
MSYKNALVAAIKTVEKEGGVLQENRKILEQLVFTPLDEKHKRNWEKYLGISIAEYKEQLKKQ